MIASPIAEIEDRLRDLTEALRDAGLFDIAAGLETRARDFCVQTRVRKGINTIRLQLEHWRTHPDELPDSARIILAANRLEDTCREALTEPFIRAAEPKLAAKVRRKLSIVALTLLGAGALFVAAWAAIAAGFDPNDLRKERRLPARQLARGEEASLVIDALRFALLPDAVRGVQFAPLGGCKMRLPNETRCAQVSPRLWAQGRLPTYEIKLQHETYGLLFAIDDPRVIGDLGTANLLLAATDETPEGRYEIPFEAAYLGYSPQACELLGRIQQQCPQPRRGPGERHPAVRVPLVVVDVVAGDPARRLGEKRRAQAEAEEKRRKAEARAQQIAQALKRIDAEIGEARKLVTQQRWAPVRERVDTLTSLFQPLDALTVADEEHAELPAEITAVRLRFEALRDKLDAFEQRVFERIFAVMAAESNRKVAEDRLLLRIAGQFGIPKDYVESIYTDRADEIQRRFQAQTQAHLDQLKAQQAALERRCGAFPKNAWSAVADYLRQIYGRPDVDIALGECMTPRLSERDCWVLDCEYQYKQEVAVERPKIVTHRDAEFFFVNQRPVRHRERSHLAPPQGAEADSPGSDVGAPETP